MRRDLLRKLALACGLLGVPALPAWASNASDLKLCLTANDYTYDADIEDACDRYLESGAGKKTDRSNAFFARAMVIAADKDFESALDDINAAIELVPSNEAYLRRAFYLIQVEKYDDAITDLNVILGKDKRNAIAFYLRGRATFENDGDYDAAQADLDRSIKLAPDLGDAYLWRGHLFADDFDTKRAVADYTAAIRYGMGAEAYYARAEAYYDADEDGKALADLDEILKTYPNDTATHRLRGEVLGSRNEYDQAIAEYDAVLRANARDASALAARAALFLKKGNAAAAIADYTAALAISSPKYYYTARANAYQAAGDLEKAIADQKAAIAIAPYTYDYQRLIELYKAVGNDVEAEAAFNTGLEMVNKIIGDNPNYADNFSSRAGLYRATGRNDLALADYAEAIRISPSYAYNYDERAKLYDAMGNPDAAAADRAKAQEMRDAQRAAEAAADSSDSADEEADADDGAADDDSSWGVKGRGTIQKMH